MFTLKNDAVTNPTEFLEQSLLQQRLFNGTPYQLPNAKTLNQDTQLAEPMDDSECPRWEEEVVARQKVCSEP
jgi:hypothetical protein